ncbi:hypothetical protein GDO78_000501 [Eleutherodactylus coqui]|uniref:Uncharacterized protein n=1 Tax=Eleutherodactylus coqui TaxID=57060 RepID=A0A8J6FSI4_ELECQ|nr:hypothetical protein GDO78_000501 [Eleutherodactylus coqui]
MLLYESTSYSPFIEAIMSPRLIKGKYLLVEPKEKENQNCRQILNAGKVVIGEVPITWPPQIPRAETYQKKLKKFLPSKLLAP